MGQTDTSIQVQVVKGGFILTTYDGITQAQTEVFTSPGKLIKAIRTLVESKPDSNDEVAADGE